MDGFAGRDELLDVGDGRLQDPPHGFLGIERVVRRDDHIFAGHQAMGFNRGEQLIAAEALLDFHVFADGQFAIDDIQARAAQVAGLQ